MPANPLKGLTLRGLEVFTSLARTGSVAATASELGLSAPAVSQQMKNLSQALGVELLDHSRRPMTPTPAGRLFLERAETALELLRAGQRDLTSLDLTGLSALSLGVIEDFENEVTPTLAMRLAEAMSQCAFRLQTGPSHTLAARLADRALDVAICAAPSADPPGTVPHPLVRDPYILAVPRGVRPEADLAELSGLAFLRRDLDQVMGQQIEAYLGRAGLSLPQRFEIDSNQSISALVASGTGWTITTPLSLLRAGRFAGGIDALPLPGEPISRRIVLYAADDWAGPIPEQIATLARELIGTHFLEPGLERMSWLGEAFALLG
ncbi:LysR family transcriptional regulator [Roseibacterium sp. SDUM158017]|uniref:LysR family transcriptional regulator n=1 Tax=Roseicyclus salinarum TaxID=3036773 RepID=UPI002414D5A6|nr:LysR family transcriptional regulator [Roseibacterium sp. SDUM158017]MDG4649576.1 LysR family transcriptional regulator [Roseibacterium sp. SDUM158017]